MTAVDNIDNLVLPTYRLDKSNPIKEVQ